MALATEPVMGDRIIHRKRVMLLAAIWVRAE